MRRFRKTKKKKSEKKFWSQVFEGIFDAIWMRWP